MPLTRTRIAHGDGVDPQGRAFSCLPGTSPITMATGETRLAGITPSALMDFCHSDNSTSESRRARRMASAPSLAGGTSRPSAFAVLRLTTSSTLVDRWTGRSAVRPTYEKRSRPMADDAEMTLIPPHTEPATGSAAAEPPKQDTTNVSGRLCRLAQRSEP